MKTNKSIFIKRSILFIEHISDSQSSNLTKTDFGFIFDLEFLLVECHPIEKSRPQYIHRFSKVQPIRIKSGKTLESLTES